MLNKEDIITCKSWFGLHDYSYDSTLPSLPTGVVGCDITAIPEFFERIKHNKNKYIVISSYSDFGLCYQSQHPVWNDMKKAVALFANPSIGYSDWNIGTRCNKNRCKITDKYSVKCYSFTECTFNEIPSNVVHWFTVNSSVIDDPRITQIPFGVSENGNYEITSFIPKEFNRRKPLYVNFQFYTNERYELYRFFETQRYATARRDVPMQEFLQDLYEHEAVLCPVGNGFDCYRTYECLYMNTFPIIENVPANNFLIGKVPVVPVNSLYSVTTNLLNNLADIRKTIEWNLDFIKLPYWKEIIRQKIKLL